MSLRKLRIAALIRYPLKSGAAETVTQVELTKTGLLGDRNWMWVTERGEFVTQRTLPALALAAIRWTEAPELTFDGERFPLDSSGEEMPVQVWGDECVGTVVGRAASEYVSKRLGAALRLVRLAAHTPRPVDLDFGVPGDAVSFADKFPVLITTTASAEELTRLSGVTIDMARMRPNIVIDGALPFEEDHWHSLSVGTVELAIPKPCSRCEMVDVDPTTGQVDRGHLAALAKFRKRDHKVYFGQNAIPRRVGLLQVGAEVQVEAT